MTGDGVGSRSGSELDCSGVLADVWLYLDNEMDADAKAKVAQHLDDCSPCLQSTDLQDKLRQLVHRGCTGERAPEHLRDKLLTVLQEYTVTRVSSSDGSTRVDQVRVVRTVMTPPEA